MSNGNWTKEQLERARRLFGIESASELDRAVANITAMISILREWDREASAEGRRAAETPSE